MSEECKTRYEIQRILTSCISAGLEAYAGQDNGFGIMEFAQASFQSADKIVLYNLIRSKRIGWQHKTFATSGTPRTDEWLEEQSWQIHTILKASKNPSVIDMQATDIADMLVTWFNGSGCDMLRKSGVACLRIDSDQILVYNDDSELYQKRAVFTVKIQVPKELSVRVEDMDMVVPATKPI